MRIILRPILRVLARFIFRVKIRNCSDVNFTAHKLLIVANHESFIDGLLIGLFLPVDPVFVVNTQMAQRWLVRWLLSQVDYLTVDPASPMAMKKVIRLIESGRPVVIFPEGRITLTGSLMKIYEGPAFVAAKTGATVIPVHLTGTAHSYFSRLSGLHPRSLFPRFGLTLLPARLFSMPDAPTAKERRRRAGEQMRRLMQDMIFSARPTQTLYGALCEAARLYGRRRRLFEDIKQIEYSYNDLLKMALILGRQIERVTQRDEKVGLLLPNLVATIGLIFGLTARGRVPAMLNYTAGRDALEAACSAAQVKTVISSRAFIEQAKLSEKIAGLQGIKFLYLEDIREQIGWADKLWLVLWGQRFPRLFELATSPEAAAVVLYTSGSEGRPKGVVLPHRAILANIAQIRAVIEFSVHDKVFNALPVFHSFGLTAGALLPILSGASLFLYPSPLHYRVIPELAYDRSCTVLFGTSTFLGNYAKFAHPYDFYRLRTVVAGAEKLSEGVRSLWFEKFGLRILEGYGATETAPVLAVNTPMAYRSGTVGTLLPGIEHQLIPVPGIARGGLLYVRGPNVMSGYLRAEKPGVLEVQASALGEGWYETGDVVEIDEEGFLRIVGRVKRFAKIAGEMVSLELVEKLAIASSPEHTHAATSQADAAKGEALVLFTTDPALTRERLIEKARERGLPELAVPRKMVKVDSLPLLGTGKIDYVSLKQMAHSA
jgi:acyl-[acyl-carrier-protein]-phospholipid O-acyltransferase/long-chain-fatty-acid--[acyl-carrier-protein] ligase